jgi:hypothetical protein
VDSSNEDVFVVEVGMKRIWPETSARINNASAKERP